MEIPQAYHDLLRGIGSSVLSVVADDGSVQSSLVWSDLDNGLISVGMLNTAPKLKSLITSQCFCKIQRVQNSTPRVQNSKIL